MMPRTFELVRHRDLSGVSGTGVVAEGCVFTDGSVALRWRGNNPATAVWPDLDSVLAVHGHHGATEVHWLEGWTEPSPPELPGRPPLGERGARPVQDFLTSGSGGDEPEVSEPPLDSTVFSEHTEPAPSETGRTFLDAAHLPLDGPTILPRLAGLDYAPPLDGETGSWDAADRTAHADTSALGDGPVLGDGAALGDGALDDDDRAALDELFGVQHAVLPPSGPVEPGGRVRGWAGARHRR
ncbi:hypothetical protein [Kribbella lupini]|uniref:Uncharacterized protein n=1 Tax=Kribbella lupini TaxID=291602 RepID=A0ABN2A448_9ACTN